MTFCLFSLNDSESLTDTGTGTIDLTGFTETPETKANLEQGTILLILILNDIYPYKYFSRQFDKSICICLFIAPNKLNVR